MIWKKKNQYKNDFLHQKVTVTRYTDRMKLFLQYCKDKDVIHFGCTDYPIFKPENNLHIKLSEHCRTLSGFDIDQEGIELLKKYVNQPYYSKFKEIEDMHFDTCLVPETIEHVDDIGSFLKNLNKVNASIFVITAPNCFAEKYQARNYEEANVFNEFVHPDHNCWFSPYTLSNVINKYTDFTIKSVSLLNKDSMVAIIAEK